VLTMHDHLAPMLTMIIFIPPFPLCASYGMLRDWLPLSSDIHTLHLYKSVCPIGKVSISHSAPLDIQHSFSICSDVSDSQYALLCTYLFLYVYVTQLNGKKYEISLENCCHTRVFITLYGVYQTFCYSRKCDIERRLITILHSCLKKQHSLWKKISNTCWILVLSITVLFLTSHRI
jgi:hypothetical protein